MNEKESSEQGEHEASKVRKLEEALKEEHEKSNDYLNRLMYLQADFENYRKRMEKETRETVQRSNEQLITSLLGVIDELELAIQSCKESQNKEAILEGVEMILKKIYAILGGEGLTKIEAVGKPFDPSKHEVVLKVPTSDYAEGTVIEEVRKGFMLNDKVVRPSIVKVALPLTTPETINSKESGGR